MALSLLSGLTAFMSAGPTGRQNGFSSGGVTCALAGLMTPASDSRRRYLTCTQARVLTGLLVWSRQPNNRQPTLFKAHLPPLFGCVLMI